jgi:hypothetical protein
MIVEIRNFINEENDSEISFKINFGINKGQVFTFNSKETNTIKMGRKKGSNINMIFQDEATSKNQCM